MNSVRNKKLPVKKGKNATSLITTNLKANLIVIDLDCPRKSGIDFSNICDISDSRDNICNICMIQISI